MVETEHTFRLARRVGEGVVCDADGLWVGGVALLERASEPGAPGSWRPRAPGDLDQELSRCYGLDVEIAPKLGGLEAVARALGDGDLARAQIVALHLRLPDPPDLAKSVEDAADRDELARLLDDSGCSRRRGARSSTHAGPRGARIAKAAGSLPRMST